MYKHWNFKNKECIRELLLKPVNKVNSDIKHTLGQLCLFEENMGDLLMYNIMTIISRYCTSFLCIYLSPSQSPTSLFLGGDGAEQYWQSLHGPLVKSECSTPVIFYFHRPEECCHRNRPSEVKQSTCVTLPSFLSAGWPTEKLGHHWTLILTLTFAHTEKLVGC